LALAEHPEHAARAEKWLRILVIAASFFVMLLFVLTALERLHYPYELEQLEGYVFLTALRAFHGQPLYPRPSLEFLPYMYPPVYYYVCAAAGHVMGMSIATLRAVSSLSTLGCFAMIYELVRREIRQHLPAIAAAGLYAGCYALCTGWFDLGRLDSFFILTVLLAMYATRWWHPVIAAALWTLAFQTKQSILPAAFVMLCFDFGRHRRRLQRTLTGVIVLALGAAGTVLWLNHATGGWYSFYVFTVPAANADLLLRTAALFLPGDLLRPLALALIVLAAAALFTRPTWHSHAARFYLAACSLVPLFWWIRTHSGSTVNALMPIYALVAVLFGLALARLLSTTHSLPQPAARAVVLLVLLAALAQVASGIYNPGAFRPNPPTVASMATVVAHVRSIPGDVYIAQHPYYAYLAGKPTEADITSLHDVMRPGGEVSAELRGQLQTAFATHRYSAVVLDSLEDEPAMDAILGSTDWRSGFPVQHTIPNVWTAMHPDWILLPCANAADCKP
jgi:4-amino-4-deoxy-L-arabinose transferase-like glycosyltransferase